MNELSTQAHPPASRAESTPASGSSGPVQRIAWDEWGSLAALVLAFLPTVPELVDEWILRPEYSHGFLMPLIAGWVVWNRRDRLRRLPRRDAALGWGIVAVGLAMLLLGEMKLSFFLKPVAFCVCVGGLVWAYRGWAGFQAFFPALIPLALMCPLPGRVERDLTVPLKNVSALLATGMLNLSGIPTSLEGNTIHIVGIDSLFVAEACSGIRSLISLGSIALLAAVFWQRPLWLRISIVAASVPIAIAVNALRIWLTGVVSAVASPELAEGVLHYLEGFVLFGISALLLLGVAYLLDMIRDPEVAQ